MFMIVLLFLLFTILYVKEKRRFVNAIFFGFLVIAILFEIALDVIPAVSSQSQILTILYLIFLVSLVPITIFILTIGTFFNSKRLLEKEGKSLKNLFFALIGVGVTLLIVTPIIMVLTGQFQDGRMVIGYVYFAMLFGYVMFLYSCVISYAIFYHLTPVMYQPDYIIALGSGLIGDKVPPLLASRLNKAVELYHKKKQKTGVAPMLIMSGGQGSDELLAEADAMKQYILANYDIPSSHILVENQSVNTAQNMAFSKKIIEQHAEGKPYRSVFVTNEFHVFRASIYARKAGLDAEGVGAKTAFYYVPNAFTREFIGLLEMNKLYHIIVFLMITGMCGLLLLAYT